jgi:hypothetical protein
MRQRCSIPIEERILANAARARQLFALFRARGQLLDHSPAQTILALVDHAGDHERVDDPPGEADEDEVGKDLQHRRSRLAHVEAVRAEQSTEEPQHIGEADGRRIVDDLMLDV